MRARSILIGLILAAAAAIFFARPWLGESHHAAVPRGPYHRIVSLAPSVTETVFALGLGDRVVGVSRFCRFPPEVEKLPNVGGMLDPNIEAIVALEPDLVLMLIEHEQSLPALEKMGLNCLSVNHQNIEGILASLNTIGQVCDAQPAAERLRADLQRRMRAVTEKLAGRPRPRVLAAVDRAVGAGKIEDVYIAGRDGHIHRLIELAGGQNAYAGPPVPFPIVSAEGLLQMDPEVILDLSSGVASPDVSAETILADWRSLDVAAVRNQRVYSLREHYVTVPGPRFIQVLERIARILHPEVDWEHAKR